MSFAGTRTESSSPPDCTRTVMIADALPPDADEEALLIFGAVTVTATGAGGIAAAASDA